MKYLIWAVILYFAWRWYLTSKDNAAARADAEDAGSASAGAASGAAASASRSDNATEKMVACAHCAIHLPVSEALAGADHRHYCCEEHRALHAAS